MATADPAHRQALEHALEALCEAEAKIRAALRDGALGPVKVRSAQPSPQPGELLEVGAAAERFGLPPDTIRKWCRTRDGLGERRGGRWQVRLDELRRLIDGRRAN